MGLMMCDGKFVSRDEIALVPTPCGTESWKPVPHMEVIDAVTDVVKAHNWQILDENFGLAREGQKMFGVMRINKSNSSDWSRCIGLRNSHDKSFAVGLSAFCRKVFQALNATNARISDRLKLISFAERSSQGQDIHIRPADPPQADFFCRKVFSE